MHGFIVYLYWEWVAFFELNQMLRVDQLNSHVGIGKLELVNKYELQVL